MVELLFNIIQTLLTGGAGACNNGHVYLTCLYESLSLSLIVLPVPGGDQEPI